MPNREGAYSILVIAYYAHDDPVFRSAVLELFQKMDEKEHYRYVLLTFEGEGLPENEAERLEKEWASYGIRWERMKSLKLKPKFLRKVVDFWAGIRKAKALATSYGVDAVYSEGFPSAIIGHHVSSSRDLPHIVHTFEPHAEYMAEGGVWSRKGWAYRILSHYQDRVAKGASLLISGTERMLEELRRKKVNAELLRLPSCVDLDRFRPDPTAGKRIRDRHGIPPGALLIVYLGKLGGMYYDRELLDLFKTFVEEVPEKNPHFMILTGTEEERVHRWAEGSGVEKDRVIVKELSPEEVPQHLSAADIALSGVRQAPSKAYCSPIKHGEYWGCGLPIMVMRGVSEDDLVVGKEKSGVVIEDASRSSYREAVGTMVQLMDQAGEGIEEKCRAVAEKERSLEEAASVLKEAIARVIYREDKRKDDR